MFAVSVAMLLGAMVMMIVTNPWRHAADRWPSPTRSMPQYSAGKGYQLSHSLIAFGRGELTGQGLGGSVEKLHYLPEAHTDFLLAVIGEELGFIGVACVILAFFWLTRRIFVIGRQAVVLDRVFAGLMVQGIGLWIGGQTLINMGVNLGALPTKGLTLPLLSYGGSAILMNLVALAIVVRVDIENRALMRGGARRDCRTWSSWRPAPAATSSPASRWPARCRSLRLERQLAGHGHRHGEQAWCRPRSIPLDVLAFLRLCAARVCCTRPPAGCACSRPSGMRRVSCAGAACQRGAGAWAAMSAFPGGHDGQPAGQAADAGQCRCRACC